MQNKCEKCGSPLAEGSLFCFTCGTRIPNVDSAETKIQEPQNEIIVESKAEIIEPDVTDAVETNEIKPEETTVAEEKPVKKRPLNRMIALLICAAVIVCGLAVACVSVIGYFSDSSSIKSVISDYVDAVYLGEYEKAESLLPEYVLENEDTVEALEALKRKYDPKSIADDRSKLMDLYFGNDITVSCDVAEFERISGDAKQLLSDLINLEDASHSVKFDEAYRVVFEVNVVGTEKEETYTHYSYALQYDGEWYLYNIHSGIYYMDIFRKDTPLDNDIAKSYTVFDGVFYR